jgi:hypothetical protein
MAFDGGRGHRGWSNRGYGYYRPYYRRAYYYPAPYYRPVYYEPAPGLWFSSDSLDLS